MDDENEEEESPLVGEFNTRLAQLGEFDLCIKEEIKPIKREE